MSLATKNICQSFTIAVGTPQTLEAAQYSIPYPLTLRATPGVGGTLLVEYRISATGEFSALLRSGRSLSRSVQNRKAWNR